MIRHIEKHPGESSAAHRSFFMYCEGKATDREYDVGTVMCNYQNLSMNSLSIFLPLLTATEHPYRQHMLNFFLTVLLHQLLLGTAMCAIVVVESGMIKQMRAYAGSSLKEWQKQKEMCRYFSQGQGFLMRETKLFLYMSFSAPSTT